MCDNHENTNSGHLDVLYLGLTASDQIVAKAIGISEISQIAKAELRLRKYLEGKWNKRANEAVKVATLMAKQLKPSIQISNAIDKIMRKWAPEVTPTFNAEIVSVYRLARIAGHKKATRQTTSSLQFNVPKTTTGVGGGTAVEKAKAEALPNFDLVDEDTVAAMNGKNTFWIGQHYDENLSDSIRDTTKETMVQAGKSPKEAGALMADKAKRMLSVFHTPGGFAGTSKQYFEGLVANAMTVGRAYGQMRSFADIGITKYTIVNPGGSRICSVCQSLQGKTFTLQHGLGQISREFKATKPEDIKKIHPWPKNSKSVAGKNVKQLAAVGLSLPPYHFRCRCTADVATTVDYASLKPMPFPVPPKRTK